MDHTMLLSAAATLNDYHVREQSQCATEIRAAEEWNKEIDDNANSRIADRQERLQSKRDLLQAVEARRAEVEGRISELARLATAINAKIDNMNSLFTQSFKALKASQVVASQALHGIGKSMTTAFRPISLPAMPVAASEPAPTATSAPVPTKDDATTSAFIEENKMMLEAQAQQLMASCEGEGCRGAYAAAYNLYRDSHMATQRNWNMFERQRASLKAMVKSLEELLAKKRAKLAKLTNQAATMASELGASAPVTLSGVLAQLKEHEAILRSSCADMQVNGQRSVKEIRSLADDIFAGGVGATGTAAATGGEATGSASTGGATELSPSSFVPPPQTVTAAMDDSLNTDTIADDSHTGIQTDANLMDGSISLEQELANLDAAGVDPIHDTANLQAVSQTDHSV